MIALGIDPGTSGAIALVCARRGLLEVANLPTRSNGASEQARVRKQVDPFALRNLLSHWWDKHSLSREYSVGAVERMQPFRASMVTLLSMGHSAGICEASLAARCDSVVKPLPQQWKKAFGLGSDKNDSREVAQRFWSDSRIRRHDLAEAALIAQWALGEMNGADEAKADPLAA